MKLSDPVGCNRFDDGFKFIVDEAKDLVEEDVSNNNL